MTRKILRATAFVYGIEEGLTAPAGEEFSAVHGSSARRFDNILCIAYGRDPNAYSDFVQRGLLSNGRAPGCAQEYQRIVAFFRQVLLPYVDVDLLRSISAKQWMEVADVAVSSDPDNRVVPLLFATTRVIRGSKENREFTDERGPQLAFGAVRIRVPEGHKMGEVERPWNARIFSWTIYRQTENDQQHFVVRANVELDRDAFIDAIQHGGTNQALIFVHGFNNTFEDGAFRLAQIVWDTQFKGMPILFSWPAQGGTIFSFVGYRRDLDSATFSRAGFVELLQLIQDNTQISTLHVIAHSMGNQIVVDALSNAGTGTLKKPLAEVVMAAPDVDRDIFVNLAGKIKQVARGVTLYASSADKALVASKGLALGSPRAGDVLPPPAGPVVLPGIDTIDVSAVGDEIFGLDHNVFAAKRSLINEIGRLILTGDRPPNQRTPEIRGVPEGVNPPTYWRYAE